MKQLVATIAAIMVVPACHSNSATPPDSATFVPDAPTAVPDGPPPDAAPPGLVQQAYVKATNTDANDRFGTSVALSADGTTLAVGAPQEASSGLPMDNSLPEAGAVYVYVRSGETWAPQAYIKASAPSATEELGGEVALSADGSVLVVGAMFSGSTLSGAAYVFTRSGTHWTQQAKLTPSNPQRNGNFGSSVAISGDASTIAVAARGEASSASGIDGNQTDTSMPAAGAVYVFTHTTAWTQQAYVKASDPHPYAELGDGLALTSDGSTMIVGAPGYFASSDPGKVYAFARSGATWTQQASILDPASTAGDAFGASVAIIAGQAGQLIAIGAPKHIGHVYMFAKVGGSVSPPVAIVDPDAYADGFGDSVAMSGDGSVLAIGSPWDYDLAYRFVRDGATWDHAVTVRSLWMNGLALSADGITFVTGNENDDSNATGIDGDPHNGSAPSSGAATVYVFE
jgi:hypothetical protein